MGKCKSKSLKARSGGGMISISISIDYLGPTWPVVLLVVITCKLALLLPVGPFTLIYSVNIFPFFLLFLNFYD